MRTKLIYNSAMENNAKILRLSDAAINHAHRVLAVAAPPEAPEWAALLNEIGFMPGETVTVTAHGMFGQDPIVVRVGVSTFAMRRAEADCIHLASLTASTQ